MMKGGEDLTYKLPLQLPRPDRARDLDEGARKQIPQTKLTTHTRTNISQSVQDGAFASPTFKWKTMSASNKKLPLPKGLKEPRLARMNSYDARTEFNTSKLFSGKLNESADFDRDLYDSPDLPLTTRTVGGATPSDFTHKLKIDLARLKKKRDKSQKPLKAVKVARKEVEQVQDAIELLGSSNQLLRKLLKQATFFTSKLLLRIGTAAPSLKPYWTVLNKCMDEVAQKLKKQIHENEKQLQDSMFQVESDDEEEIKIDFPSSREKTMIELLQEPTTPIELDLSPRSLPSIQSMPMPKEKKDYHLEDLQKVIRELTVKLRKREQSEILIADPYLERVRQEVSGEDQPSLRPSLLSSVDMEEVSTHNTRERSFLHNIKDAWLLQKDLDAANEKVEELEWAITERNKQVDDLNADVMKWKKKFLEIAGSKKKQSISETPTAPRSPKTEDVLRAVQHSLFKQTSGMGGTTITKAKGDKSTLERLRKVQEQLFEVTNILKQEVDPNDHRVPARLAFITSKLLEDYPEPKQLALSRQLYQQIREAKPQNNQGFEFSDILSKQSSLPDPMSRFNSDIMSLGQTEEPQTPAFEIGKTVLMEKEDLIYLLQAQARTIEKQL